MATKKRVRSHDSTSSNWSTGSNDKDSKLSDHMQLQSADTPVTNGMAYAVDDTYDGRLVTEHELFLQAFEKPTQIYRYLRTRQIISPIFLTRSLTYMRHRLRRTNTKRRRDFSIDSLLQYVIDLKQREAVAEEASGNLSLSNLFIKNTISSKDDTVMTLETSLLKMGHQKRKDVLAQIYQFKVGKSEIVVNTEELNSNILTINKNELNENNGEIAKQWSYSLLFIASCRKKSTDHLNGECLGTERQFINDFNDENSRSEVPVKRRRVDDSEELYHFKAELIVYDRHKHCLLTDGVYTVVLQPCAPPKISNRSYKPNKFSSWQQIDAQDIENLSIEDPNKQYGSMEVFRKGPVLKFRVSWSMKPNLIINGFNPISSNDNENDSGIGNNMSDNSSQLSFNGLSTQSSLKAQISNNLQSCLANKRQPRVTYQFLFNNNTRQQTKPLNDLCCPWCSLNCQKLYSLIKHLKLCHNRFAFTYSSDTRCARIDVAINDSYDGSYAGNPHDLSFCKTGFAFSRNGPVRRNPVTHVIVCRPKRSAHSLTEFDEPDDEDALNTRIHITGHNRLYYHTNSCLPIRAQEMDYDSEAENDPEWLREKTQLMIDEFTDVNEGEKEVMKMWNLHVMKNGFVGDCQIHLACLMFVEEKGLELIRKQLYKNFILHLNNLYDFGLLNASTLHDIIKKLQQKTNSLSYLNDSSL